MKLQVLNFPQGGEEWERFRSGKLTASKFDSVFCGGDVTVIKLLSDHKEPEIRANAIQMKDVYETLKKGDQLKSNLNASGLNSLKKKGVIEEIKRVNVRLSSSHDKHINRMICENLFNSQELGDFPGSYATDRGNELEQEARNQFCEIMKVETTQVGCVRDLDFSEMVSVSPDDLLEYTRDKNNHIDSIQSGVEYKCPYPQNHLAYLRTSKLPNEYVQQVHGSMAITGASHWWFMSYCPKLTPLILKISRNEYTEQIRGVIKQFLARYDEVLQEVQQIGKEEG